MQKAKSCDELI